MLLSGGPPPTTPAVRRGRRASGLPARRRVYSVGRLDTGLPLPL